MYLNCVLELIVFKRVGVLLKKGDSFSYPSVICAFCFPTYGFDVPARMAMMTTTGQKRPQRRRRDDAWMRSATTPRT